MKIHNLAATLLTMILSLGAFQAALAENPHGDVRPPVFDCGLPLIKHTHACASQLSILFNTIFYAEFANARDRDRLQSKVCAADGELHASKPDDAYYKLENITNKVNNLLSDLKEKIDPDDAGDIKEDVEDAQDCIMDPVNYNTF